MGEFKHNPHRHLLTHQVTIWQVEEEGLSQTSEKERVSYISGVVLCWNTLPQETSRADRDVGSG